MDSTAFLQYLSKVSLEEGRAYIQAHIDELADHAAIGVLISDYAIDHMFSAPFVSLKLAELLIFFSEYVHHARSHALALNVKGNALACIGQHQKALEYMDIAGEEFLQLGDEVGWARTRTGWIFSATWLGRTTEALQVAARAREAFLRHDEYYRACRVDHNTAMVYTRLGRYQDAIELYERMLITYSRLPVSETLIAHIAFAECNQAINLVWLGKFEQAYHLLQQAKERLMALEPMGTIAIIESNLAELDYAQGYYGSALQHYYQAHDFLIQNQIDDPFLLVRLKLWMANCLVKLDRAQEACQSASEAVETCRQLGVSLDMGEALRQYATALVASNQPEEALTILDEAWTLFAHGGFEHYAKESKLQHAELLLEIGSPDEAYDEACLVKDFFDTRGLVSHSARAGLVMVGALLEQAQQAEGRQEKAGALIQQARLLCKQITLQARQYNLQEQVYRGQHLLGRLAFLEDDLEQAARHYGAAIAQIERILTNLVHDLSPSFLHTVWIVYEDMIALCLHQGKAERAFIYLERARSVVLRQYLNKSKGDKEVLGDAISASLSYAKSAATLRIQREIEEWQQSYRQYSTQLATLDNSVSPAVERAAIEAELKRCEAKLSELFERLHLQELDTHVPARTPRSKNAQGKSRAAQQVAVLQLRQHLVENQLLLAYFICQGKLIVFALTPEGLTVHENPDGAEQLEHLLLLLDTHLQPDSWLHPQQPSHQAIRSLLTMLYKLLIGPLEALLPPSSGYLTIVPYSLLHNLPFHALYNGSRFLIEDYQINYLPASSVLPQLNSRKERNISDVEASSQVPLVFGYSGNGSIGWALEEARAVATLLGGHCYLEDDATIAQLTEHAPGSPIIHVATHGQSRLDAPNFSSVLLADGHFNALDVFGLTLKDCELVTLSGCETGLALSSGGDEQLGLGRAFLAAGASSLVMSLWPVEDTITSKLMQFFYQRLLRGDSKVQALRAAQIHVLSQHPSMYAHPYFWAAFRLVGEVGPIRSRRASVFTNEIASPKSDASASLHLEATQYS